MSFTTPKSAYVMLLMALPLLGFGSMNAYAQVHMWTDENGVVHFSDVPPQESSQSIDKVLEFDSTGITETAPATPAAPTQDDSASAPSETSEAGIPQPSAEQSPPTIAQSDSGIDLLRCDKIRQDLMLFDQNPRIRQVDPETQERVVLTEEQREAALQQLLATRDQVCP